ncbi:MAG: DUF268 domain-containing protein [Candidatus Omnitrophota bacterium]|jgi:SAM-dependent methyltransferase
MKKNYIIYYLKKINNFCCEYIFDPVLFVQKIFCFTFFVRNLFSYNRSSKGKAFQVSYLNLYYRSFDRYKPAGSGLGHYFLQDLWAARILYKRGIKEHVDVGSRLDGFIGNILPFCKVEFIDIRPLKVQVGSLRFKQGSICRLPFLDSSVGSISSLHVIEHVGLGRYGDPIDPEGHLKAAGELSRVLKTGGMLLISVPVGKEKLYFDGHRIFDPNTILSMFAGLKLVEFSLIDDHGKAVMHNAPISLAQKCSYGCGLFIFEK